MLIVIILIIYFYEIMKNENNINDINLKKLVKKYLKNVLNLNSDLIIS